MKPISRTFVAILLQFNIGKLMNYVRRNVNCDSILNIYKYTLPKLNVYEIYTSA